MTISYTELNGSGTIQINSEGMRGVRIFRVIDYADAQLFAQQLLGVSFQIGTSIQRTPPARFAPGSPMYCTQVRIEGLGKPQQDLQGNPSYDGGAKLTANYQTLPYDPEDDDRNQQSVGKYLTETLSISGKSLSLPKEGFQWSSDGEPLGAEDISPGMLIPQGEYRLKRHQVPELPKTTLFNLIGKVNDGAFAEVASETLLFLGAEARREHTSDGSEAWEIELHFNYAPEGHNHEFRTSSGEFEKIVTSVGSNLRYPTADFSLLIPEANA